MRANKIRRDTIMEPLVRFRTRGDDVTLTQNRQQRYCTREPVIE